MRHCLSLLFLLGFVFLAGAQEIGQRKKELEERKVRLMDEIALANRILAETQKDRQASLGDIETVQQKIRLRSNLIRTLDKEISLMAQEELSLRREMDTLRKEEAHQKEVYAEMIRQAYKSKSRISRLMFILSSESFNQAYRRLNYLKQYSAYRQRQIRSIEETQEDLRRKAETLRVQKVRKQALRGQLDQEKERLSDERLSQEEAIAEFKDMERDLESKLKAKQNEARKVEKEIQRIIAAELARARKEAERDRLEREAIEVGLVRGRDFTSNTAASRLKDLIGEARERQTANPNKVSAPAEESSPRFENTPVASQLAANFAANQRRLPWPVEKGLVVTRFGTQRHPVVKSVIIENKGIDIATEQGSAVRAIFDGQVSSVFLMPDGFRAVIVNHGGYFSVYQNLGEVKVTSGQSLSKGMEIGLIAVNPLTRESRLHFEIWKDDQVLDPLTWLAGK